MGPLPSLDGPVSSFVSRAGPRGRRMAGIVAVALIGPIAIWESFVYRAAAQLAPAFSVQQLDGDQAWEEYQRIRGRSPFGLAPLVLRAPLHDLLMSSSERIVEEYRDTDQPRLREGDWQRCKRYAGRIRQLDSSDTRAAAMLEYADGHLLRINKRDTEAIDVYSEIVPWGDSATQIKQLQALQSRIESRLKILEEPKSIWDWFKR